jgi:hypothetical protein
MKTTNPNRVEAIVRFFRDLHLRHVWIYFCRPEENPQWDQFRYCPKCGQVAQYLFDSQGGSYVGLDENNECFVTAWIKSHIESNAGIDSLAR